MGLLGGRGHGSAGGGYLGDGARLFRVLFYLRGQSRGLG
jgi:hypothetical protein